MLRHLIAAASLVVFCVAALAQTTKDYGDVTRATPVSVTADNLPPKVVFDEIAKQAGIEFSTITKDFWDRGTWTPISLAAKEEPFWVVMKDACAKAGVSLKYATDTAEPRAILARDNQDWTKYPTVANGPFLVSLIGLHRASTVDMRKPADVQRTFYVKFTVFCEPRFRLLRASQYAKVEDAKDDKGNSLIPAEKDAGDVSPTNFVTSWVYNLEGKLEYPREAATAGTKIPRLRCSARLVAQTRSETIEYADPLTNKPVTKAVAGRKVVFKDVRRGAEEYEATVTIVRDQVPPAQWENTVFPGNALRLIDGEGKQIVARGFGLGGKGDEGTYVFKFEKEPPHGSRIGKPLKLAWEIPVETREIPLTFEFRDVPIP
jgi:hypothetical protein